jgi:hypothetical protein
MSNATKTAPASAAEKAAKKATKAMYRVKSPIFHAGERHEIDDEVELTQEQAESLPGHSIEPKAK